MKTKTDILKEIYSFGYPNKEVAISIDDYFNDNSSDYCIGYNIYPDPPSPKAFYQLFKDMISSGKADKILVRITDIDEFEDWFSTDTVYIIGNLSMQELKEVIESLSPDEIYEEWMYGKPANVDDIKNGQKVYSVWWD